jgi:hypothetical protein
METLKNDLGENVIQWYFWKNIQNNPSNIWNTVLDTLVNIDALMSLKNKKYDRMFTVTQEWINTDVVISFSKWELDKSNLEINDYALECFLKMNPTFDNKTSYTFKYKWILNINWDLIEMDENISEWIEELEIIDNNQNIRSIY